MQTRSEERRGATLGGVVGVFVTLAGITAALTILWLSMRSVMDIGGACASGGPFVPRVACPHGVPLLLVGSIWIGLVFAGLYVWQTFKSGAPSLAALLWPALFLSLGWNFLEYGLDPPFGVAGVAVGWLVCAVVFGLMGGLPLLAALPAVWTSFHGRGMAARARDLVMPRKAAAVPTTPTPWGAGGWFGSDASATPTSATATPTWGSSTPSAVVATGAAVPTSGSSATPETRDDLVGALERLSSLHRTGALTDAQYEEAKRRVLGGA